MLIRCLVELLFSIFLHNIRPVTLSIVGKHVPMCISRAYFSHVTLFVLTALNFGRQSGLFNLVVVVGLEFNVPLTTRGCRHDLGLQSHPEEWRSGGSNRRTLDYIASTPATAYGCSLFNGVILRPNSYGSRDLCLDSLCTSPLQKF